MTNVRAVAVGIPERLRDDLSLLTGVLVLPDLLTAAGVLEDFPGAAVIYGEDMFGMAVTGQPVFLLGDDQRDGEIDHVRKRVWVVTDWSPRDLDDLTWDDPRRLVSEAAVRLRAGRVVDVSVDGALDRLDLLLREGIDAPREGGHTEANGNDETNGDPDGEPHHPH